MLRRTTSAVALIVVAVCAASAAQTRVDHARAIDPKGSTMTVYVYKQGLFAFAADNHVVRAPIVAGSVDEASGRAEVTVDATKMQVLDPKLAADRRAQVQANMVGPQVLDVRRFPMIAFRAHAIKPNGDRRLEVLGDLTLHGQTHPMTVDVEAADRTHFTGAAVVRQTEFGITPIRIAGGLVRVKDDVKVVFTIALR